MRSVTARVCTLQKNQKILLNSFSGSSFRTKGGHRGRRTTMMIPPIETPLPAPPHLSRKTDRVEGRPEGGWGDRGAKSQYRERR